MASLMDSIMNQYYSGAPGGSALSNPMMSTSIGQGLTANPVARPFTPSAFGPLVNQRMGSFIEPAPISAFMGGPPMQRQPVMPMGEPGYSGAAGAMVPTAAEAAAPMQSLPTSNIPMPPPRPRDLPGRTPGFLDQLLSGPNYQSNNMPVDIRAQGPSMPGQEMPIQSINYGDPNSAADFFRADRLAMQNPNIPGFLGGY